MTKTNKQLFPLHEYCFCRYCGDPMIGILNRAIRNACYDCGGTRIVWTGDDCADDGGRMA